MDPYEATKVVFSRIQSFDSVNASKIMGLILIQEHGEKEMIRLAFGPENLLHSVVVKARQDLGITSPQNTNPRFLPTTLKIPTTPSSWGSSVFSDLSPTSINGGHLSSSNSSKLNPSTPPFYCSGGGGSELMDEIHLQDQLAFLNDGDSMVYNCNNNLPHRRSYSVSDINLDDPSSLSGWKPCLYYARGFCKNGSSCRFIHGSHDLDGLQHQKLMAAAMASSTSSPTSPYSMINKGLSLFSQQQQNDSPRSVATMMDLNPASRQIYLTFPADSTFREEDVSNYFSIYGAVQDVRIPYQQKRMFGFVTFVYPETVKIILAKGNPHFVCDARVLVKPYKEKGKVPDKFRKQQQQMDRGEFSGCNSPTAIDTTRDPFDLQLGSRMMYDTQYMLWKRKLEEQVDLEQALELQTRRLIGLQLLDIKRNNNHHHRSFSTGAPIPSPTQSPNSIFHQNLIGSDRSSPDTPIDNCRSPPLHEPTGTEKEASICEDDTNNSSLKECPFPQHNNLPESLELNLPDSPFASQTRGSREYMTAFSDDSQSDNSTGTPIPIPIPGANTNSSNNTKGSSFQPTSTPFNSCYFQMPRFSPGHGAVGM